MAAPSSYGKAIFHDPFHGGLTTEEQQIAKIFWRVSNPIQHVFHLTQGHRTKDPWLKAILEANRFGNETWEMYCCTHGLPTRNPGSWLPDQGPTCGNANCQTWAQRWQEVFDAGATASWTLRRSDECSKCKAAREERNRIISTSSVNTKLYLQYLVHGRPLRSPFCERPLTTHSTCAASTSPRHGNNNFCGSSRATR